MPHTRSLATLALLVFATLPMTGCVYYRTLFKPDKQAEIELEKRKKESAKYGAKIVWEDQEKREENGVEYTTDYVLYDYGSEMHLVSYTRTSGTPKVRYYKWTQITRQGCWYLSNSDAYKYGWSGNNQHAVMTRKKVTQTRSVFTNCGEYKDADVWGSIKAWLPEEIAAHAEENGSAVLSENTSTSPFTTD